MSIESLTCWLVACASFDFLLLPLVLALVGILFVRLEAKLEPAALLRSWCLPAAITAYKGTKPASYLTMLSLELA